MSRIPDDFGKVYKKEGKFNAVGRFYAKLEAGILERPFSGAPASFLNSGESDEVF
jgi:hypothetical protein